MLPQRSTCTDCVLQRSRHEAPTDRASLRRLLHGARRTGTQGACSSLPPGTQMQSACRPEQAPALIVWCNGAAMKLRLMEQACDGAPRCEADRDSRCVLVFASRHSDAECLPPRAGTCTDCVLQRSRHGAPTDGASLQRLLHGAWRHEHEDSDGFHVHVTVFMLMITVFIIMSPSSFSCHCLHDH